MGDVFIIPCCGYLPSQIEDALLYCIYAEKFAT